MTEPHQLRLSHVSWHAGSVPILTDVTVDFPHGKVTGLLGPNGSGNQPCYGSCLELYAPHKDTSPLTVSTSTPGVRAVEPA